MTDDTLVWQVPKASAGERLDRFLHQVFARHSGEGAPSRRQIRRWIEQGRIYIERSRCRVASKAMVAGQRVSVIVPTMEDLDAAAPDLYQVTSETVLYEDEHLLVLDKPPGVPSQATRQDAQNHLLAAAQRWLRRASGRPQDLWLHHRLDRGTSGVILLAKTSAVNGALTRAFGDHQVDKRYVALASGRPAEDAWTVDVPLQRVRGERGRPMSRAVDPAASMVSMEPDPLEPSDALAVPAEPPRDALTEVTCLERFAEAAFLALRPKTGRMHQIRVHLAWCGHPVLGDRLYGTPEGWRRPQGKVPRPLLHAQSLHLRHPVTSEDLELQAALPTDMQSWIKELR